MQKDILIIYKNKQILTDSGILGIKTENLQGRIIFKPEPFVDGTCRMYVEGKGSILMEKQENCYTLDILSSLLTDSGLDLCFKITEPENEKGIPIFCSKIIHFKVYDTIETAGDIPEDYPSWEQVLDSKIAELDALEETVEEAAQGIENLDIDVSDKVDGDVTITLTKKDNTTKTVVLSDGTSLMFNWNGTSLGIKTDKDAEYVYVDLKGATGDTGPQGEPGQIKFIIVQTLPISDIDTSAIYLLPITPDEGDNNYAEYIYVNNQWELLGKIGVHLDLNDYVKNTDYATSSTGGVLKTSSNVANEINANGVLVAQSKNYAQYSSGSNGMFISKGTLENVIAGKELTDKSYVDGLVGDIERILEVI